MTARAAAAAASLLALTVSACTSFYEVPIETPIQPKMDVSAFQRVLIAGFLAGGSEDVDANLETVRLLRSQLRSKSGLRVIDADVLPLLEVAVEQRTEKPELPPSTEGASGGGDVGTNGTNDEVRAARPPRQHRSSRPPRSRLARRTRRASRTRRTSSRSRRSSPTSTTGRRSARNSRTR